MKFQASPEFAVAFAKASVFLVCSWPPNSKSTRSEILRFGAQWWVTFFLLIILFLPLLNGVWVFRNDPVIVVKAALMTSATAQALMKIIVCRHQRRRLQALHEEMEFFLINANPLEKSILQHYAHRCCKFYSFITVCVYFACIGFIIEPLILAQPFPTDSAYPFFVEFHPLHEIIYVQQAVAILHIAAALSIDSQVAILFWFTGARFEMLGRKFENACCEDDINCCIREHQKVLCYANEVKNATRLIALATIATSTIGIICGGLTLISRQPLSVKLRVGNMVFNASIELFLYAWPADNLMDVSNAIGKHAYNSSWLGKTLAMRKSLLSVIQRSQRSVTISVGGFLPALSLYHYASFLSSSFSYFTTLRIAYNTNDEI